MIKRFAILVFPLFPLISWSQNSPLAYSKALKMYNLTTFDAVSNTSQSSDLAGISFNSSVKTFQLLHPTIAFQWKTKKKENFHEIELSSFSFRRTDAMEEKVTDSTSSSQIISGSQETNCFIAARYEYIFTFFKTKDKKFLPSLGLGINSYFLQSSTLPKTADLFPVSETLIGSKVFLTPRINYYLSPKLFLDFNIPLCIMDFNLKSSRKENPVLPINQQRISVFQFQQFPTVFSARIGVGIKL
jgi:hypothetical protein